MDSITQIVLGAAMGEVVAGRRLGNRAMLWGAVGGTIPDLDVVSNFWLNDLEALVVHRGITHSLLFVVVAPFLLAWLVGALYRSGLPELQRLRWMALGAFVVIMALLAAGVYRVFSIVPAAALLIVVGYLSWRLYNYYVKRPPQIAIVPQHTWYWLFFWAFSTHILLDCFTAYGTQVFLPFSNYRVAFNTIAVADPAYTVPFAVCVLIAAFQRRTRRSRRIVNWIGIGLSSAYLLMTVFNKHHVDNVFHRALVQRGLPVEQCRTSPTILNNILWNCTAEGSDVYYVGLYSLFDSDSRLHYVNRLPKQPDLVDSIAHTRAYQVLHWFADGYLLAERTDSSIFLTDIRFGAVTDTITSGADFVFRFELTPQGSGFEVTEQPRRPPDMSAALSAFFKRVQGY